MEAAFGANRQSLHLAGRSDRGTHRGQYGLRHPHDMGRRTSCQSGGDHCGHISAGTDARGAQAGARRTLCRACSKLPHGFVGSIGPKIVPHEDGHARPHRQAFRTFRGHGGATGRDGFPSLFLHQPLPPPTPTPVLDVRNERRSPQYPEERLAGFAALQRTNTEHRPALLPKHRDKDCHLPRPQPPPALLRTRGMRHERTLSERLFIEPADGDTNRGFEEDALFQGYGGLPSRLCN